MAGVAGLHDICWINYRGALMDGTVFVSSDYRTEEQVGKKVDPAEVAARVKELEAQKDKLVHEERYDQAKKVKQLIQETKALKSTGVPPKPKKFLPEKVWHWCGALGHSAQMCRLYLGGGTRCS